MVKRTKAASSASDRLLKRRHRRKAENLDEFGTFLGASVLLYDIPTSGYRSILRERKGKWRRNDVQDARRSTATTTPDVRSWEHAEEASLGLFDHLLRPVYNSIPGTAHKGGATTQATKRQDAREDNATGCKTIQKTDHRPKAARNLHSEAYGVELREDERGGPVHRGKEQRRRMQDNAPTSPVSVRPSTTAAWKTKDDQTKTETVHRERRRRWRRRPAAEEEVALRLPRKRGAAQEPHGFYTQFIDLWERVGVCTTTQL